jgi:hypothetical protein
MYIRNSARPKFPVQTAYIEAYIIPKIWKCITAGANKWRGVIWTVRERAHPPALIAPNANRDGRAACVRHENAYRASCIAEQRGIKP